MTSPTSARLARWAPLALTALVVLTLAACAAGANDVSTVAPQTAAGFWLGLWHGAISPITFVVSLFSSTVGIYEVHNNGAWYDFGFMLGVSIAFGGGARSGRASRRRSRRAATGSSTTDPA